MKVLFFLEDVDIKKLLVSNKISSGKKNYKFFIGYLHDDDKVKSLHIMLPKTSAYLKSYDGQTKWKIITYWKNIILFGITSALIFKKNLTATLSTKKNILLRT